MKFDSNNSEISAGQNAECETSLSVLSIDNDLSKSINNSEDKIDIHVYENEGFRPSAPIIKIDSPKLQADYSTEMHEKNVRIKSFSSEPQSTPRLTLFVENGKRNSEEASDGCSDTCIHISVFNGRDKLPSVKSSGVESTVASNQQVTPTLPIATPERLNLSDQNNNGARNSSFVSIGPLCRICYDADGKQDLISPCRCSGSVAKVHKSCLERWLTTTTSGEGRCELCLFTFSIIKKPKSFLDYLVQKEDLELRRMLWSDFICLCVLTPLILSCIYLCFMGIDEINQASIQMDVINKTFEPSQIWTINSEGLLTRKTQVKRFYKHEILGLVVLAFILFTIYSCYLTISIRFQYKSWRKWRNENQVIILADLATPV